MDPVSLTAAVCSLTAFAGKTVALLADTRSAFKTSSDDYTRLLKETEVFYILLQHVSGLIANDGTRMSSALTAVAEAIAPCASVLAEIQARIGRQAQSKSSSSSSFARLRRRIKFVVSRKSLQDLRAELVSHRSSLTIALQLHSICIGNALVSRVDMKEGEISSIPRTASDARSDGLPLVSAGTTPNKARTTTMGWNSTMRNPRSPGSASGSRTGHGIGGSANRPALSFTIETHSTMAEMFSSWNN